MLKTISWPTLGISGDLHYNTDSTVQHISYAGSGTPFKTNYIYGQFGLTEIGNSASLSKQFLFYNNLGHLIAMNKAVKQGSGYREYVRETFDYNAAGRLETLRYFHVNESGKTLISTSTYRYNALGLPEEITTIDKNNNKNIITIEKYSNEFLFDAIYFLDPEMGDLNSAYNYSILTYLSTMRRLPARIKVTDHAGGQSYLVKQIDSDFNISSLRLNKQINTITGPAFPSPQVMEIHYIY